MLLDQSIVRLDLFKISKTLWLSSHVFHTVRKHYLHCANDTFGLLILLFWFQSIYLHRLYQAMDTECVGLCETFHEGELEKFLNHLVEGEKISHSMLQQGGSISCIISNEFLWDLVRG